MQTDQAKTTATPDQTTATPDQNKQRCPTKTTAMSD
jgi:hypothetical protein